jgi:AraC-like DNA-binding protein
VDPVSVDNEQSIAPAKALRPWISEIVVAGYHLGDRQVIAHLPDTATVLVYRVAAGEPGDLRVMGPRTRAAYHPGKDVPVCVKLRIRPGRAQPLLGIPVSRIVDRVVPLSDLWGQPGRHLAEGLADPGADPGYVIDRIEAALLAHLAIQRPADLRRSQLLQAAAESLASADYSPPGQLPEIARSLRISERHLRNLFALGVGISPKHFARIDRVRSVLNHAKRGHWAQLAARAGYYDQSHMTGEFRRMMGVPPTAFIAGHLPAARPC